MFQKLLLIAVAGGVGSVSRFAVAGLVQRYAGAAFPWGTVTVNVVGCFLAGLLWQLFETRITVSAEARMMILVGFMGAFTTFSTFMLETSHLTRDGQWAYALGNVLLQNTVGFAAVAAGIGLGRWLA